MSYPIPALYTSGLTNKRPIIYIVRLVTRDSWTVYFSSRKRGLLFQPGLPKSMSYKGDDLADNEVYDQYLPGIIDEEMVEAIAEIDYSFEISSGIGGLGARAETYVYLLNQTGLSDTFLAHDIEHSEIEIWQGFDIDGAGNIAIESDFLLLFKGVVYEVAGWDNSRISLRCFDRQTLDDKKCPPVVITAEDFPSAPEALIGQPMPVLFGDFQSENTQTYGTRESYEIGLVDAAPTVMVNNILHWFYLASHPIKSLDKFYFVEKDAPWTAVIDNSGVILTVDGNGRDYYNFNPSVAADVYVRPKDVWSNIPDMTGALNTDQSDAADFVDSDANIVGFNDFTNPGIVVPDGLHSLSALAEVEWNIEIEGAIVGTFTAYNRITGFATETALGAALSTGMNKRYINMSAGGTGTAFQESWEGIKQRQLVLRTSGMGFSASVKNIFLRAKSIIDLSKTVVIESWRRIVPDSRDHFGFRVEGGSRRKVVAQRTHSSVYVSAKGAVYGGWISGRGHTVGDLIENPAGLIEWLLREIMGVSGSRIDTASFDNVGHGTTGVRKDWKFAASLLDVSTALEYIRRIGSESGLITFLSPDASTGTDVYRCIPLPTKDSPVVLTVELTDLHIAENGRPSLFQVGLTPFEDVINDVGLNYRHSYALDKTERERHIADVNGTGIDTNLDDSSGSLRGATYVDWFAESQTKYGSIKHADLESDFIRKNETADKLLKLYADWSAFRRVVVRANFLRTLALQVLQIGDVTKLNLPQLGLIHAGVTKFMLRRVYYPAIGFETKPYFTLEFEEIPNGATGAKTIAALMDEYAINTTPP